VNTRFIRYAISIVSIFGIALTAAATAKADTVTFWNVTAINTIRTASLAARG
jgi:hypothetical protein